MLIRYEMCKIRRRAQILSSSINLFKANLLHFTSYEIARCLVLLSFGPAKCQQRNDCGLGANGCSGF